MSETVIKVENISKLYRLGELGTGTLSNGLATFTTATLIVGSHSLTAVYGGDGNDSVSGGAIPARSSPHRGTN